MGKSGFAHYKASAKERVKADLQSKLPKGGRLSAGAVMSELNKRWELLPDSSREIWNRQTR
jgi:hypothetical protein